MAKFKITYSNGKTETVEQSDGHTEEQMINCRFGTCDTSKVKVELVQPKKPLKK